MNPSREILIPSVKLSEFNRAVEIISGLRSNIPSVHGLPYRSMICTVVRNDPHLLEFLLRNLITGFSHIVIYDNNRILAGYDTNISALLAPFIAAGVVTHVPWQQNTTDLLPNTQKNLNSVECLTKYGHKTDWLAILDTDEYIYYETDSKGVNVLNHLLTELEEKKHCGIRIPWTMMYGEGKLLKQNGTLLESYPRECVVNGHTKVMGRPNLTIFNIPHEIFCNKNPYSVVMLPSSNKRQLKLIHYFSKSIEEFLVKVDQSVPPYIRAPMGSYDSMICTFTKMNYSKDFLTTFFHAHQQLEAMTSLRLTQLLSAPPINVKHMSNYALYIYLKYRCAMRHEFDNEKYLLTNPEAKAQVQRRSLTDGLHHFMANFGNGAVGCWKTENRSFCE